MKKEYIIGLIIALFLYLFYQLHLKRNLNLSQTEEPAPQTQIHSNLDTKSGTAANAPAGNPFLPATNIPTMYEIKKTQSEQVKREFLSEAHISANFPSDYEFKKIDVGDDAVGIIGEDQLKRVKLGIVARPGITNKADVENYIRDEFDQISELKGYKFEQLPTPQPLKPEPNSGIREAYVWSLRSGNKALDVVLGVRDDGKGSYIGFLAGPPKDLEDNADGFEQIAESIKATP